MTGVRTFLRTAPWWAVGAVQGVVFAVIFAVLGGVQRSDGWADATISGLIGGAFFGLISGLMVRRRRLKQPDPLADLDATDRRRVECAALRGPIPADPADRRAAAAHTRYQLELMGRAPRTQALIVFTVFLAADLVAAVLIGNWLYWVLAVAFVALITQGVRRPQRLQRRLTLLTAHDGVGDVNRV